MRFRALSIVLGIAGAAHADFVKVNSFQEIGSYVKELDKDDLVVCDIGLVLVRCKSPAFHLRNEEKNKFTLLPYKWKMSQEEKDIFYMGAFAKYGAEILESDSVGLVNQLHERGVKVLAITTAYTGTVLGKDMVTEHQRWLSGYNLSKSFGKKRVSLTELSIPSKATPFYQDGILFRPSTDCPHSKGQVLKALLEKEKFVPRGVIVLIDDVKQNLEDMEKGVLDLNPKSRVIKLQYTGEYDKLSPSIETADIKRVWEELYVMAHCRRLEERSVP